MIEGLPIVKYVGSDVEVEYVFTGDLKYIGKGI
jgi:hypothetical protein